MSKQAFEAFNKKLTEELSRGYNSAGLKASGEFERFVKSSDSAVFGNDKFVKFGTPYTPYMDVGSGAPKNKTGGLWQAIYGWLQYKKYGLDWSDDKERQSMAWGIYKNRLKDGSYKRRNPDKRTNVIATAINNSKPTLLQALGEQTAKTFASEVGEMVKRINKEG